MRTGFRRVGASDVSQRGLRTFMVEMQETASILKEATQHSSWCSTRSAGGQSYDGMSIARSVLDISLQDQGEDPFFNSLSRADQLER